MGWMHIDMQRRGHAPAEGEMAMMSGRKKSWDGNAEERDAQNEMKTHFARIIYKNARVRNASDTHASVAIHHDA